tara:strand:- start:26 stop:457 length:432 start_codon:yes stop_codon:yes gene_type:complete
MSTSPKPFDNLDLQPLAGEWRKGSNDRCLQVTNPYTGKTLMSLQMANQQDMDEAFARAEQAQAEWAALPPAARAEVMLKAVSIFDARQEEIISWLIQESGSTRLKATIEWSAARGITLEAASMPKETLNKSPKSAIIRPSPTA